MNKQNLNLLAVYLWNLGANYKEFDMSTFIDTKWGNMDHSEIKDKLSEFNGVDERVCEYIGHCGTAACAVGHAPSLGLIKGKEFKVFKPTFTIENEYEWVRDSENSNELVEFQATKRVPTGRTYKNWESWAEYSFRIFGMDEEDEGEWDWCFSGDWSDVDNTNQGAAKRIVYLIEHGLPANYKNQMYGRAPLCYVNTKVRW